VVASETSTARTCACLLAKSVAAADLDHLHLLPEDSLAGPRVRSGPAELVQVLPSGRATKMVLVEHEHVIEVSGWVLPMSVSAPRASSEPALSS